MQRLPVEGIDTLPLCNPSCPRLAANLTLYFLRFSLFVYKISVKKKEIHTFNFFLTSLLDIVLKAPVLYPGVIRRQS